MNLHRIGFLRASLMCVSLSAYIVSQVKTPQQPLANGSQVARVGIQDFKKLRGDKRLDALEQTLPQLLRAGLFSQKWLDVTLIGKGSPESVDAGSPQRLSQTLSSSAANFDVTVEGEFLQINEDRIRLNVVVNDVLGHVVIFQDSVDLQSDQILADMGQTSDRITDALREKVLARAGEHLIAVVGPFENNITDSKLEFLASAVPLAISGDSDRTSSRKNLAVEPVIPGTPATSEPWNIRIAGKISVVEGAILISGLYEEPRFSLPIEYRGPASEPLKAVDNFSRKVWEVLAARTLPAGGFRNDPVLQANASAEELYTRGQEAEKAGEPDAALFLYSMALRKKNDYLAAHLGMAEIYRQRDLDDLSEEQYTQVLAQSSQNASAHRGLGLLYSKKGDYDRAAQQLEQALSLATSDHKLQFDVLMALGDVGLLKPEKQPDKSIQYYLQARAINTTNLAPYLSLAHASRARNDLEGAINYLQEGLAFMSDADSKALKNELGSALNDLGKQQLDAKDYSKARESFQKAISLDPPDLRLKAATYRRAGVTLVWYLKDPAKGIEFLKKAVQLAPADELNYQILGFSYEQLEPPQHKEAIEAFNHAIAISPQYESYWELGRIYRLTEQYDLGIENATKALQMEPEDARGYALIGALYQSRFERAAYEHKDDPEDLRMATENLKQAVQREPRSEEANRILGLLYEEAKDYKNAVPYLKQAITIEPGAASYHLLGTAYWKLNQKDDAITAFMSGLKVDREYVSIYDDLEKIYGEIKQPEKFTQLLKETTELKPDFVYPYIKLGYASLGHDPEAAIDWIEKAPARGSHDERSQYLMGLAYEAIAKRDKSKAAYEKAIGFFNEAIAIQPAVWSYGQLALIYLDLGDDEKEIVNLEKCIELNPKFQEAYDMLGPLLDKHQRGEEFNRLLENAAQKGDFYWAELELVKRYSSAERYDDALAHASRAINLDPARAEAYWRLASVERLKPKKQFGQAYEHAREALELAPTDADAIFTLAGVLFDQQQYSQAIKEFEVRAKQHPKSPELFAVLGDAYRRKEAFTEAEKSLEKALDLAPGYSYARLVLAQTYVDEKKLPQAIATAQDMLKKDPGNEEALSLFYTANHQRGKDQEAMQYLERLIADHPGNIAILNAIGFVSHEFTKDYQKSYDVFLALYNRQEFKDNPLVVQNFAEANLTVGRLDAVLELTAKVLVSKDVPVQTRLSMKLFQIAAYLLQDQQGKAFAELGVFRDEYRQVPKDYERAWTYEGTKSYVETSPKLSRAEKYLLVQMIDLLQASREEADAKLEKFEKSFAETFAEFKAADVAAGQKN